MNTTTTNILYFIPAELLFPIQIAINSKVIKLLKHMICVVAGVTGLEPAASGVTGRRSNQLSYTPTKNP